MDAPLELGNFAVYLFMTHRLPPTTAAPCRRGRPPACSELERRGRILAAAEQMFSGRGYAAATMDEVARTAAMSKRTLYGLYPDKGALLAAVVVHAEDFPWEQASGDMPSADPVAELHRRLLEVVEFVLSPRQIRLTRLLVAEAGQVPELAEGFYERVMVKAQHYLAAAVKRATGGSAAEARHTASALFGAATGDLQLLALFGKGSGFSRRQIKVRVEAALQRAGFTSVR